jgi:haloalkane dehalogenase
VLDSHLAFVSGGGGPTLLFLHGNPTSSFLWRGVLARLVGAARCVALDLVGMGRSGKPDIGYRFADHAVFLEAFVDRFPLRGITIVGHDWGAVLGLNLLRTRPDVVARIVVCEGHLRPIAGWDDMDAGPAELFSRLRTPEVGERMVLEENALIEDVLPAGMNHTLNEAEWAVYRAPYPTARDRLPILRWIQQIPIGGNPADVAELVHANQSVLLRGAMPRLLLHGRPGAVVSAREVAWCRANGDGLDVVDVGPGTHFLPEDQPAAIAEAIRSWLAWPGQVQS